MRHHGAGSEKPRPIKPLSPRGEGGARAQRGRVRGSEARARTPTAPHPAQARHLLPEGEKELLLPQINLNHPGEGRGPIGGR
ncbi:hypothetical protein C8J43_102109 [Sphingomonas sp. PP-CE-1G-424]|nr:hypothetical protein C8J43_102109 [Sphingomonas sp. PP-CE-1G-424]